MSGFLEKLLFLKNRDRVETERHTKDGREKPDPQPVEWPLGLRRPPTLQEQIYALMRSERIKQGQAARGEETLDDAMDFGGDDDDELPPASPEERIFRHIEQAREDRELAQAAQVARKRDAKKKQVQGQAQKADEPKPEKKTEQPDKG